MTLQSMQVRLVSTANIPDGAIVSVKAGAMRRQAPASSGRAFRFTAEDLARGELKVDVLAKVGSGSICIVPPRSAEVPQRYKLALNSETGMACEVVVGGAESLDQRATIGDVTAAEAGDSGQASPSVSPTKGIITAKESQAYLESIGVLPFMQRVLQMVVKEKPSRPFEFIAAQFSHGHDLPTIVVPTAANPTTAAAAADPTTPKASADCGGVVSPTFTGFACREFTTGDVYEGDFVNGVRHGQGKYHFSNGDMYAGEWCDDEMHGQGRMHYHKGMYYEGQWDHGRHHGRGRYVWIEAREEYEGEFQHNDQTGWGRWIHANDDVYEGQFLAGVRHGQGRLVLSDGTVAFEGLFESGKPVPDAGVMLPPGVKDVIWVPGATLAGDGKAMTDIGTDGV